MGIAYRRVSDQRARFRSGRGVLYQKFGFLFVPDGSPMTTVGDDGEGMASTHLQEYQKADFSTIRHRRALKRRNFMYSW